jgi:hypothetical protein
MRLPRIFTRRGVPAKRDTRTEAEILASIRRELAALGAPVHGMTDDELREHIREQTRLVAKLGIPAREATVHLQRMADAMRRQQQGGDRKP